MRKVTLQIIHKEILTFKTFSLEGSISLFLQRYFQGSIIISNHKIESLLHLKSTYRNTFLLLDEEQHLLSLECEVPKKLFIFYIDIQQLSQFIGQDEYKEDIEIIYQYLSFLNGEYDFSIKETPKISTQTVENVVKKSIPKQEQKKEQPVRMKNPAPTVVIKNSPVKVVKKPKVAPIKKLAIPATIKKAVDKKTKDNKPKSSGIKVIMVSPKVKKDVLHYVIVNKPKKVEKDPKKEEKKKTKEEKKKSKEEKKEKSVVAKTVLPKVVAPKTTPPKKVEKTPSTVVPRQVQFIVKVDQDKKKVQQKVIVLTEDKSASKEKKEKPVFVASGVGVMPKKEVKPVIVSSSVGASSKKEEKTVKKDLPKSSVVVGNSGNTPFKKQEDERKETVVKPVEEKKNPSQKNDLDKPEEANQENKTQSITYTIVGPDGNQIYHKELQLQSPMTIGDILLQSGLNVENRDNFINSIEGVANEGMSGWVFEVNAVPVMVSAFDYVVNPSEQITWKYVDFSKMNENEEQHTDSMNDSKIKVKNTPPKKEDK